MDRLIYTAMTGAKQVAEQQTTVAHNLANVGTSGFRAQIDTFRAAPVDGQALMQSRTQVSDDTVAADFSPGAIQQTGRALDVAVQGPGWLTVQDANGNEAYTRAGSLKVSPEGILQTTAGQTVLGDGGPLTVPPGSLPAIAKDGTVSVVQPGVVPVTSNVIGRLKLVNPASASLQRGDDGLFRGVGGAVFEAEPKVVLVSGALESSNVNVVDAMVRMIALGRQFETQISMMKNAEQNASKASQILNLS